MHDPIIIDTRSIWKLAALLCLCALAPAAVRAQAVAPPPADTTASPPVPVDTVRSAPTQADDDDLIEMSPFVVDSTKDSRYLAASSLSGSRLNTELRNVAAVIDVFTAEIIQDFGIGDLDDLMDYAANLQGGNSTIGGWGNAADTGSSFTVRGLPASRARNYFNYYYVTDTYNVERVDESRGPNAILFGFGSPGGILNISTKKARTNRNRIILGTQVSNFMAKRMTLDANQVLVKDRLALRLNAVTQSRETWRDFSRDDRNGVHAAMTFTPWKKSALYLEYEHFQRAESAARGGNTYWSQTDTWEEAGKPLIHTGYGNRNNVANNPLLAGDAAKINTLANLGARDVWVHTEETGVLANWNNMSRTNRASYTDADGNVWTAFGDFRHTRTDVPGILEVNLMGPSSVRKSRGRTPGRPGAPSQIPACSFPAPGFSGLLASHLSVRATLFDSGRRKGIKSLRRPSCWLPGFRACRLLRSGVTELNRFTGRA